MRSVLMPMTVLPHVNAALNATSALLLLSGWACIRAKRVGAHRLCMVAACGVTALFLVSYLTYHAQVGSVRFRGTGWLRPAYFTVLISHTVLAMTIVPMALRTLFLAVRNRIEAHRRMAGWTLPLWLYVSVTGVVVYLMLYHTPDVR